MSEQKAPIPADLLDAYQHYKRLWDHKDTCRAFPEQFMNLIERIARLEQENSALKDKVARLEAPVSRDEWEHHYPTLRLAWEVMTGIIAARAAEPGKEKDNAE